LQGLRSQRSQKTLSCLDVSMGARDCRIAQSAAEVLRRELVDNPKGAEGGGGGWGEEDVGCKGR